MFEVLIPWRLFSGMGVSIKLALVQFCISYKTDNASEEKGRFDQKFGGCFWGWWFVGGLGLAFAFFCVCVCFYILVSISI